MGSLSGVVTCPKCRTSVVPRGDGTCPHCEAVIFSEPRPAKARAEPRPQPTEKSPSDSPGGLAIFLKYLKNGLGLSRPVHDELSVFLIAVTFVALLVGHSGFRQGLLNLIFSMDSNLRPLMFCLVLPLAGLGIWFSVTHVFTSHAKTDPEKYVMGAFAIGANTAAAVAASIEVAASGPPILAIFPLWNIVIGMVMIARIQGGQFEVTDEDAPLPAVMGASALLLSALAIAHFVFHMPWPWLLSIGLILSSLASVVVTWTLNRTRDSAA